MFNICLFSIPSCNKTCSTDKLIPVTSSTAGITSAPPGLIPTSRNIKLLSFKNASIWNTQSGKCKELLIFWVNDKF